MIRTISLPISYFLYSKTRISANQVTVLSIICFLILPYLVLLNQPFIAILLFGVYSLLDCVDGELARALSTASPRGAYLEIFGDTLSIFNLAFSPALIGYFQNHMNANLILLTALGLICIYYHTISMIDIYHSLHNDIDAFLRGRLPITGLVLLFCIICLLPAYVQQFVIASLLCFMAVSVYYHIRGIVS